MGRKLSSKKRARARAEKLACWILKELEQDPEALRVVIAVAKLAARGVGPGRK